MATASELLLAYSQKHKILVESVMAMHRFHTRNLAHDWYHALMTAQYSVIIADNSLASELAWLAGPHHTADHLLIRTPSDIQRRSIIIKDYVLASLSLSPHLVSQNRSIISDAVLNHGQQNHPGDSSVLRILKDADKLANLGTLLAAMRYVLQNPSRPLFNPRYIADYDPSANFKNPLTTLRDLQHALEWEKPGCFRCPKAIPIATRRFVALKSAIAEMIEQFQETGLLAIPDKLIMEPLSPDKLREHV